MNKKKHDLIKYKNKLNKKEYPNKENILNKEIMVILKSSVRLSILDLIIKHDEGLKFSEISNMLNISPSTLEYHLNLMVENEVITHNNQRYIHNAYSYMIWDLIRKLQDLTEHESLINYLKNHRGPFKIAELLSLVVNMRNSTTTYIPDLISLLSILLEKMKNKKKIQYMSIMGEINVDLEYKMMKMPQNELKYEKTEIFLDLGNFKKFISFEDIQEFFQSFDFTEITFYLLPNITESKYYLGIIDDFIVLYFPRLDGVMDFQQGLVSDAPDALEKALNVVQYLKNKAFKRISIRKNTTTMKQDFEALFKQLTEERLWE